jgi:hypothetical protein
MAALSGPGQPHADRSAVEPSYLQNGDIGYRGGGTTNSGDPTEMMAQYENVFGPAAREIKWDSQRHKRHQRWHLPDALKGSNTFLTDRIDGLITDATSSPFTKNILPYLYMENPDQKIKWNVYSFDEGMASRVPYESAARVLPQSKRSFAGYAVRHGLAIAMEHNFMMSPQGMENFRRQLMQLVGSIQLTNDLDVHMALLYAPSYQKQMDEKYWDGGKTLSQMCRMYVDLFGFVQKNENALDYLIEDAKNILSQWGSKAPTFMLCNGALTRQLTMTPERTNYITAGPDGKRKLAQGPDLPSYRGISIINTRQFSLEAGSAPRDMLRRRVRVSEHYRIPWHIRNLRARYEFYDQSRDSMFYLSWEDLWRASLPSTTGDVQRFKNFIDASWKSQAENAMTDTNTHAQKAGFDNDTINHVTEGTLRDKIFSSDEITLGGLLGIWSPSSPDTTVKTHIQFLQDISFACRVLPGPSYTCATLPAKLLHKYPILHLLAMMLLKAFFKSKFSGIDHAVPNTAEYEKITTVTEKFKIQFGTVEEGLKSIYDLVSGGSTATTRQIYDEMEDLFDTIKQWNFGDKNKYTLDVACIAADLFVLRPNIEHYMLAVIFGRGGGPEELGATFWGQTELSCYDDSQHGIWGMSYKYHERAIVINDRNLIRVFDVCFDGYCGGNDSRILRWNSDDCETFKTATQTLTTAYAGPSMVVMSLPVHTNVYEPFPNPIVWHPWVPHESKLRPQPDRGGRPNDVRRHCPFVADDKDHHAMHTHQVYSMYYRALGIANWQQLQQPLDPGPLAFANEADPYIFSFHGHMATIVDGSREETQGSGHLGPNFVGVASVREGRGMLPRGMPMLTHAV